MRNIKIGNIIKLCRPTPITSFYYHSIPQTLLTSTTRYRFCKIPNPHQNEPKQNIPDETMKQFSEEEQKENQKKENKLTVYVLGVSVVALLLAYVMMEVQGVRANKKLDKSMTGLTKVTSTGKANIGGQWQMLDTKGNKFGSKNLEGSYYLIYFGFTNCPDICPNSLVKLSKALQKIRKAPESKYINLQTIFISVDPQRDTPEKIDKFLSFFDKTMIGVTGTSNNDPQLRQCMKKFKIYASKIEFEDEETVLNGRKSYTIDHTILTYLMNDSNQYLAHLGANLGEHQLAKTILDKIKENERQKMKSMKTL